jgi:putative N6-adenine-specific DNA methylase
MADTGKFRMIAKTLFGLEDILADELRALGAVRVRVMNRSVEFFGDKRLLYSTNLRLRTATRVIRPIKVFRATDDNRLYSAIRRLDWSGYLKVDGTFAIDALVKHSGVKNSHYAAQKTKDAIADQFRSRFGRRPSVNLSEPDLRVNLHLIGDTATLSLDSSGEPLFRRGYRKEAGKAPINEALAAGILTLTGWNGRTPLVDGMCGSGTFLIEAAMLARNMAPGLRRRHFGFMRWPDFDFDLWNSVLDEARSLVVSGVGLNIAGSDSDPRIIRYAKANAKRAGVDENVVFSVSDMKDIDPPSGPGILITNPPYGKRLSEAGLEELYGSIGDILKEKYNDYKAYIFTANIAASRKIGLKPARRFKLFNPPLEAVLLEYEIYRGSRRDRRKRNQRVKD